MYIGPDVIMPLASAVAAIVGVAIMFWNKTVAIVRGAVRVVSNGFAKVLRRG